MTSRVITDRWAFSLCSSSRYSANSLAAVTSPLLGKHFPAIRQFGFSVFTKSKSARTAHPLPQPHTPHYPRAVQLSSVPPNSPPAVRLFSPFTSSRRYFNTRITRKGALLPPHSALQTVLPYRDALNWFISRPLTFSACTMAASGKIDLNSPSTSWKEAKNYLKGLNSKQRREHYAVKDYIKLKDIPTWKDTAKKTRAKQPEEVKFPKNKDLNEKISVFRGDITKLEVDAIVNAANSSLLGGGGVDGCIHRAAGPLLKLECSSLGGCETGQAKMTCGYLLPAKCVIHTVGPVAQGNPGPSQKEELMNCYKNSMYLASEGKLRTVAFPCISTGVFGYPAEDAAEVALEAVRLYLEENKDKFDRIIICVFLEKDEEIYMKKLPEYFPLV
ncbi:ADP-ribose glycohydrolase MACROD1 isoform X2 [Mixophyes fleayi]|uniref:ADP-ribose glycohydrolase MACROD1 isoform X2 n=1 Tax=Mixophyes fleayi TaxID=3061075 RepID=UPI003F4D806E